MAQNFKYILSYFLLTEDIYLNMYQLNIIQ